MLKNNLAFIKRIPSLSQEEGALQIEKINLIDWLKSENVMPENIEYVENLEPEYRIARRQSHDGTMIFTHDLIGEIANLLLKRESYYKLTEPDWSKVTDIKYKVGPMEIQSKFGQVNLPCGKYSGVTEDMILPVRCEYIYQESI